MSRRIFNVVIIVGLIAFWAFIAFILVNAVRLPVQSAVARVDGRKIAEVRLDEHAVDVTYEERIVVSGAGVPAIETKKSHLQRALVNAPLKRPLSKDDVNCLKVALSATGRCRESGIFIDPRSGNIIFIYEVGQIEDAILRDTSGKYASLFDEGCGTSLELANNSKYLTPSERIFHYNDVIVICDAIVDLILKDEFNPSILSRKITGYTARVAAQLPPQVREQVVSEMLLNCLNSPETWSLAMKEYNTAAGNPSRKLIMLFVVSIPEEPVKEHVLDFLVSSLQKNDIIMCQYDCLQKVSRILGRSMTRENLERLKRIVMSGESPANLCAYYAGRICLGEETSMNFQIDLDNMDAIRQEVSQKWK